MHLAVGVLVFMGASDRPSLSPQHERANVSMALPVEAPPLRHRWGWSPPAALGGKCGGECGLSPKGRASGSPEMGSSVCDLASDAADARLVAQQPREKAEC